MVVPAVMREAEAWGVGERNKTCVRGQIRLRNGRRVTRVDKMRTIGENR